MIRLAEEMVRWNVIVTGVAVALTSVGACWAGAGVGGELLGVVACGTFVVYGVDRWALFSPEDRIGERMRKPLPIPVLVTAFALLIVLASRLTPGGQAILIGLGTVSALYILPVLPGHRRLKDVPYAKSLLVAVGWAVATTLLPAVESGIDTGFRTWCLVGYRSLFLLPNLLLADWPDRNQDRSSGIHTFANRFSPRRFARIGQAVGGAGLAACVLLWAFQLVPEWSLWEMVSPVCFIVLFRRSLPESPLFYAILSDVLVGWPGLVGMIIK